MSWVEQARGLLHNNESIREEVRIGSGGVVVTNQRLLVFTPEQSGANFRQVDRPNVESVECRTSGNGKFLMPGLKAGIVGLVMVAFGYAFNFDSFAEGIALDGGTGAAGAAGLGGMLGIIQTVIELFALLDELLRIFGGLALAFSAVAVGVYVWSRERRVVVSVAGEGEIELAADDDVDDALLDRLRTAIQPDGPAPATTPGGFGEASADSSSEDSLGDSPGFGGGDATTGQGTTESPGPEPASSASVEDSDPPEPVPVDEDPETVRDSVDDTEREGTTADGSLDLTDPTDR